MLFELLVLTGAQVGLDWTSILRMRDEFRYVKEGIQDFCCSSKLASTPHKNMLFCRAAFSGFDIDVVANYNQRQIASITAEYGLDSSRVRGAVDNANCILEVRNLSSLSLSLAFL